jgi:hypothetical protein
VAGCGLHESGDQTWQVKAVTLSALPAEPRLTVVTAVAETAAAETAAAAHPGVAPLTLCTLSNTHAPLWLTLCVWH